MWAAPRKPTFPLSPLNCRALLCVDHKAKIFSSAIRESLALALEALAKGNQSGAIKGGGTEFPLFIAKLFLQHAVAHKVSAAILFGDMQKAYYSVLLELVFGPLLTAGEKGKLFSQDLGWTS